MDCNKLPDSNKDVCTFCRSTSKKYTCPRCNADYCSLTCFQSASHVDCSESFYQKCVLENMPSTADDDSKQKMMEVLNRLHDCSEEDSNSPLDSDDDDTECGSLEERLANINLEDTNEVWKRLTADERQEFEAFLRSGDVSKFVPKWQPWWLQRHDLKIQEVEVIPSYKGNCPNIKEDIKEFSAITKKPPSACVQHSLVNILTAYAFTVRYFNGDHFDFLEEAVGCAVCLSLCLKENRNFENKHSALASVHEECVKSDWITVDEENINLMKEDVELILSGPQECDKKFYILSALSDFHNLLRALLKKGKAQNTNCFLKHSQTFSLPKEKAKLCLRKLEYFLSYAMYYSD